MHTPLTRLVLLIVMPLFLLSKAAAADRNQQLALDPAVSLNGYVALVGQQFGQIRTGLRIVAASENAASGDWNRIKEPLGILANGTPTSAGSGLPGRMARTSRSRAG